MDCVGVAQRPKESRHRSSDKYLGNNVHARPQLEVAVLPRINHDLHRNSLHNLDVIAGGIFRRKQTEKRAGRSGNAVDMAGVVSAVGIDIEFDPLSWT